MSDRRPKHQRTQCPFRRSSNRPLGCLRRRCLKPCQERDNAATHLDASLVRQCSNGIVVPEPQNNPGLVKDCAALLTARDALAGAAPLNWSADRDISSWWGVVLGLHPVPTKRVDWLNLGAVHLTGTIPPELSALTELRHLDLSHNQLTGPIPAELGKLSSLEVLFLGTNGLTGPIPSELAALNNLQLLDLSDNRLTGSVPAELRALTNLELLNLSGNQLTGGIAAWIGDLTELEVARAVR